MVFTPVEDYPLRSPEYVVVHHSATRDTLLENFDAIFTYHTQTNGWRDIGYHAVAELVMDSPVIQYARPEHIVPACVGGFNERIMCICFVGNFDIEPPDQRVLRQAVWRVVAPWCVQYSIPVENVVGHNEVPGTDTACPGELFDMAAFRELVNDYLLIQDPPA